MKIRRLSPLTYALYTGIILLGIALDQLTKWLAVTFLQKESVVVIKGILRLRYLENEGAAFGMLADSRWVFITVSVLLIAVLLPYLYLGLAEGHIAPIAIALILSGGIGNMIDRIALGYVVDFIDVYGIRFAVFNVADSFVCVGATVLAATLLWQIYLEWRATQKKTAPEAPHEASSLETPSDFPSVEATGDSSSTEETDFSPAVEKADSNDASDT